MKGLILQAITNLQSSPIDEVSLQQLILDEPNLLNILIDDEVFNQLNNEGKRITVNLFLQNQLSNKTKDINVDIINYIFGSYALYIDYEHKLSNEEVSGLNVVQQALKVAINQNNDLLFDKVRNHVAIESVIASFNPNYQELVAIRLLSMEFKHADRSLEKIINILSERKELCTSEGFQQICNAVKNEVNLKFIVPQSFAETLKLTLADLKQSNAAAILLKAYNRIFFKYHSDSPGTGCVLLLQIVETIYEFLSNDECRKLYLQNSQAFDGLLPTSYMDYFGHPLADEINNIIKQIKIENNSISKTAKRFREMVLNKLSTWSCNVRRGSTGS